MNDPRLPAAYQDRGESIADPPDNEGLEGIPPEAMKGLHGVELDELFELYGEAYEELMENGQEYPGWENIDWDALDRDAWLKARKDYDEQVGG